MTPTEAMTTDQHRDWCAADDGWRRIAEDTETGRWRWQKHLRTGDVDKREGHPYPPTRDGAAKAMPEGWKWSRDTGDNWRAWIGWETSVETPDTGDEIADRYRLAVACRLAERDVKG